MPRIPSNNRLKSTDQQFYTDYRSEYVENTKEVYSAYGDTVRLLRKKKAPNTGINPYRGKLGGRRTTEYSSVVLTDKEQDEKTIFEGVVGADKIPAIVKLSPTEKDKKQFGIFDKSSHVIHISSAWLLEHDLEIDPAEDRLQYKGTSYSIIKEYKDGNFLNVFSAHTYIVEESL